MQQFDYRLTIAICTRTSALDMQILRKNSQQIYASPSQRTMDSKGVREEMSYPNIFFTVDNYEELLNKLWLSDGEIICVEVIAKDRCSDFETCIFSSCVHYEIMKCFHDSKKNIKRKFMRKQLSKPKIEFMKMRGPGSKGQVELAMLKIKEQSDDNNEPYQSLSDYEFEELEDNHCSKRRMSDPSNTLRNCVGWHTKRMQKSRSAGEGVNVGANGILELEAGDLKEEFNDAAYCRLWNMRGFSQAYYFWKEKKRISQSGFKVYITYLTLPWHYIIADLLGTQRKPTLTF